MMIWVLALAAQDTEEWARRLGGTEIELRERAVVELALRGEAARAALERVAAGTDVEAAGRARVALGRIPLVAAVDPNAFPGLRERLAAGKTDELVKAVVRATEAVPREALLPLARPALELAIDDRQRTELLRIIADRRLETAAPAFAGLLDNENWPLRQALFDALGSCRPAALAPEMLKRMRGTRDDRWIWAMPLARMGRREIVPDVLAELLSPTSQRGPGLAPLLELDAVEAAPALLKRALDVDLHHTNRDWLDGLRRLAPEATLDTLHAAAKGPDPEKRRRAMSALVDLLRSSTALPLIREQLGDPDPGLRAQAAQWLGRFRRAECVNELREALEDEVPGVRRAAALALALLGRQEGVAEILPLLQRPDQRLGAAGALAELGLHKADILRAALGPKPEQEDRHWLASHLAAMGVVEARPLILELLAGPDEMARRVSVWSLAKLDGPHALPRLRELMDDPDDNIAWGAFHTMIELLPGEAILDDVRRWTRSTNVWSRNQAHAALLKLRRAEALPLVLRDLSAPEPHMRSMTAWTCAYHDVQEAVPRLLELLRDPDVRQAAGGALLRLGRREGIPFAEQDLKLMNLLRPPPPRALKGPPLAGLRAFAARAGLAIEGEEDLPLIDERAVEVEGRPLIRVFLDVAPPHAVLEPDRIRLLNPREARRFWKRWLGEEVEERREAPLDVRSPEELIKALGEGLAPAPLLKHPAVAVRLAAARAHLKGGGDVQLVRPLLDDPQAQTELVQILGSLGRRELNAEILKRMEQPAVMWGLAHAAGALGLKEAMPALLKAIEPGPYYFGRMFAVGQIRRLGEPTLAPKLLDVLRTETDPQVAGELLRTLGLWGCRESIPVIQDLLKTKRIPLFSHYEPEALRALDRLGVKDVPAMPSPKPTTRSFPELRHVMIKEPFRGSTPELLARLAKAAGLELEEATDSPAYRNVHTRLLEQDLPMTAEEALERQPRQHWKVTISGKKMRVE